VHFSYAKSTRATVNLQITFPDLSVWLYELKSYNDGATPADSPPLHVLNHTWQHVLTDNRFL
jgi:hypothetical protein